MYMYVMVECFVVVPTVPCLSTYFTYRMSTEFDLLLFSI